MTKHYTAGLFCLLLCVSSASAQFAPERLFVGPQAGLSIFESSIGYGAGIEYAFDKNIGAGLDVVYTGFSLGVPPFEFDYSLIGALAFASYHLDLENKKLDPFVKLGVGYFNWDVTTSDSELNNAIGASYTSGIGVTGQLGMRYHFSDKMSAKVTLGYPLLIGAGVDFGFGPVEQLSPEEKAAEDTRKAEQHKDMTPEQISKLWLEEFAIYFGAYIYGKASIKHNVPEEYKTDVAFHRAPDWGGKILVPFLSGSSMGFSIEFGSASLGYQIKPEKGAEKYNTIQTLITGTSIFPHVNLGGFIIGVNFFTPRSFEARFLNDSTTSVTGSLPKYMEKDSIFKSGSFVMDDHRAKNYDPVKYLTDVTEIRVGGTFPFINTRTGTFVATMMFGYTLSGIFENHRNYRYGMELVDAYQPREDWVYQWSSDLNPKMYSISVGVAYMFRIGF